VEGLKTKVYVGTVWYAILLIRCIRPIRIFKLLPPVRKVATECLSGWREILMVSMLLAGLIFVFAAFGVQLFGGRLGMCNDILVKSKQNCTGILTV